MLRKIGRVGLAMLIITAIPFPPTSIIVSYLLAGLLAVVLYLESIRSHYECVWEMVMMKNKWDRFMWFFGIFALNIFLGYFGLILESIVLSDD